MDITNRRRHNLQAILLSVVRDALRRRNTYRRDRIFNEDETMSKYEKKSTDLKYKTHKTKSINKALL